MHAMQPTSIYDVNFMVQFKLENQLNDYGEPALQ